MEKEKKSVHFCDPISCECLLSSPTSTLTRSTWWCSNTQACTLSWGYGLGMPDFEWSWKTETVAGSVARSDMAGAGLPIFIVTCSKFFYYGSVSVCLPAITYLKPYLLQHGKMNFWNWVLCVDLIQSLFLDCAFKTPLYSWRVWVQKISLNVLASTLLAEPGTWSGGCNQEKEVPYTKQKESVTQKDLVLTILICCLLSWDSRDRLRWFWEASVWVDTGNV